MNIQTPVTVREWKLNKNKTKTDSESESPIFYYSNTPNQKGGRPYSLWFRVFTKEEFEKLRTSYEYISKRKDSNLKLNTKTYRDKTSYAHVEIFGTNKLGPILVTYFSLHGNYVIGFEGHYYGVLESKLRLNLFSDFETFSKCQSIKTR